MCSLFKIPSLTDGNQKNKEKLEKEHIFYLQFLLRGKRKDIP